MTNTARHILGGMLFLFASAPSVASTAIALALTPHSPVIAFRAEADTKTMAIQKAVTECQRYSASVNAPVDCSRTAGTDYYGVWTFQFSSDKHEIGVGFHTDPVISAKIALKACAYYTGSDLYCPQNITHTQTWQVTGVNP